MKASTSIEKFYVNSKEITIVHVRHFTETTPSMFGNETNFKKRLLHNELHVECFYTIRIRI